MAIELALPATAPTPQVILSEPEAVPTPVPLFEALAQTTWADAVS